MITHQFDALYPSLDHPVAQQAKELGYELRISAHAIDVRRDKQIIRVSLAHFQYLSDIITSFEYYYSAVRDIPFLDCRLVDYSTPRFHRVVGFDEHPVLFPSFSEPITTTTQYLDFASLKAGQVVLDLGAYSGLTSIVFKERVGTSGVVIAVDADAQNFDVLSINFELHRKMTGRAISSVFGAMWNHGEGLEFSSEGNMGAAATEFIGNRNGNAVNRVPSFTLSSLMKHCGLHRVDFIKCDVEGAESVVFEDGHFFANHRPRIIIETHHTPTGPSTKKCISDLNKFGYTCREILQHGVVLPLLECTPPDDFRIGTNSAQ